MAIRRTVPLIALIAICIAVVLPAAASAAVTTTSVTSPGDGRHVFDPSAGAARIVTYTGTSDADNPTDTLELVCMQQRKDGVGFTRSFTIAAGIATDDVTGAWTTDVDLTAIGFGDHCLVRALPAGTTFVNDLTPFTGPKQSFVSAYTERVSSGPNVGLVKGWVVSNGQTEARLDLRDIYNCGLCATNLRTGPALRDSANGTTFDGALWGDSTEPQITSSGALLVDGAHSYTPSSVAMESLGGTFGDQLPGFAANDVTFTHTLTTAVNVTETLPLVRCNIGSDQAEPGAACTALVPTGVTLRRTWTFDDTGREARMVDTYSSTDGAAHTVRAQYWSGVQGGGTYAAGWIDNGTPFAAPMGGAALALPPTAPFSTVRHSSASAADGDLGEVYTGEIQNLAPANINFSGGYSDYLLTTPTIAVPAGGSTKLERVSLVSSHRSEVVAFIAKETDRMVPPSVAISAPSAGALVTAAPVVVTGTAADNVGIASLRINGVETPVTNGTFSTAVTPITGLNVITAIVRDAAGNEATAVRSFTYAKPLQIVFTGTAKNDRLTGNAAANVLNGLAGNDTIDCGAGGKDRANGGAGNDRISCVEPLATAKANADVVNCGPGKGDVAIVDPFDKVVGCERVTRVWIGSAKADKAKGTKANDTFTLLGGNDSVTCGGGIDTVTTGAGNDTVNCVDTGTGAKKSKDVVNCGPGKDTVKVDRWDKVVGCERVTRV